MAIALHNLQPIYRGDTKDYELNFTKGDGSPLPVTDWKIYFTVKLDYNDNDDKAAISKDITVHSDPENGKTVIALLHEDTDIEPANYWYDVQVKRPDDSILTLLRGRIEITLDITRRVD